MPTLPVRNLGGVGIATDPNPYNLPINGFTSGKNVRFDEGKVKRAPVFRKVKDSLGFNPRGAFGVVGSSANFDTIIMATDDYVIHEYANGTVTNVSGSISGVSDPRPFTISNLADVVYINRPDKVPSYRLPSGSTFAALVNWPSTHRCDALRPFGDFLLALNMTEGSTNFPNRVRFSDIVQANQIPGTWSETDLTASAGFNDLVSMTSPIVDGMSLGTNFIIYSKTEAVLMDFVGGTFLFNFRTLHSDDGLINQNCVVEAEGKHFCFGTTDIYVHDGNSKRSICDETTREFIFTGLNTKNADRCFVQHNKLLGEIYFCYQSGDALVDFVDTARCNRAATYNYKNNTWSFLDLPNVSAGAIANVDTVATYATSTQSYGTAGGTYYQQEDSFDQHVLMVGETDSANGLTSSKIYGVDLADAGKIAADVDAEATKPLFLERVGIDLDEIKEPLDGYKVITRLLPQISTINTDNTNINFSFGASDIPNQLPDYTHNATFNILTDYKLDSRAAGRYLSYKISLDATDYKDISFSGFDVDVTITGRQ